MNIALLPCGHSFESESWYEIGKIAEDFFTGYEVYSLTYDYKISLEMREVNGEKNTYTVVDRITLSLSALFGLCWNKIGKGKEEHE